MAAFTAGLHQGRFILEDDAPQDGTPPLALVIEDEGDDLSDRELARLGAALQASLEASARGETFPMDEVMAGLRALRRR